MVGSRRGGEGGGRGSTEQRGTQTYILRHSKRERERERDRERERN